VEVEVPNLNEPPPDAIGGLGKSYFMPWKYVALTNEVLAHDRKSVGPLSEKVHASERGMQRLPAEAKWDHGGTFREGLDERNKRYIVGIHSSTSIFLESLLFENTDSQEKNQDDPGNIRDWLESTPCR